MNHSGKSWNPSASCFRFTSDSLCMTLSFSSPPPSHSLLFGLHRRAVLLISDVALNLLDTAELQASVAHEIGHEYVWAEYLDAAKRNDDRRLKELELICDGVGFLTLRRAGIEPIALLTAAEKIAQFNALSTGPAANGYRYPSFEERKRFAQAIITWAGFHRRPQHWSLGFGILFPGSVAQKPAPTIVVDPSSQQSKG